MTQPNDKGVTLTPATSAESRMYEAILRAEAAERKCEQLSTSLEMIVNSFEQFKKSVSLLGTQIDGFTNMYNDELEGSKPDGRE